MPSTFRSSPKPRSSFSARAQVQRSPAAFLATPRSERVIRVEEDRDRAFINQLHGHGGLKNSSGYGNAQLAERLAKFVIERFRGAPQAGRYRSHWNFSDHHVR